MKLHLDEYVYQVEGTKKRKTLDVNELTVIRSLHNIGVKGNHFEVIFSVCKWGLSIL